MNALIGLDFSGSVMPRTIILNAHMLYPNELSYLHLEFIV